MKARFFLFYGSILLIVLLRIVLAPPPPDLPDGMHVKAKVRLVTTPQAVYGKQQLVISFQGQRVTLIVPMSDTYRYGDLLGIDGTLRRKVLDNERVVYSIYYPSIDVVTNDSALPYHLAGFIRQRVETSFTAFLPPDQAGLLVGIVFGINEGVDKKLKTAFQLTGVTHVIAASGMNVTLLAGFLLPLLTRAFRRQTSLIVLMITLVFYCLLSGMSASIVRATLMASIGCIGLLLGRQRTAFISFFLTGCIMIWITPAILFDIGFQLSFAATAGMLLVRPLLPTFSRIPILRFVEDDLSTTFSAQLATLPILIFYFHNFGLFGVIVNTLVLWTVAPLMIIGSLAAVISLFSIQIGGIIAFLSMPFLTYFLLVVERFAVLTPVMTIKSLPFEVIAGYYLVLLSAVLFFLKRKTPLTAKI